PNPVEEIAVAGPLQDLALFVCGPARQRVVVARVKRQELRLARLRNRHARHEIRQCLRSTARYVIALASAWIAGDQNVAAECLAVEEHAAGEAERRIEAALEGGL